MKQGKQSGKGLKPGLNMADTGSVVHQVRGAVRFGRSAGTGEQGSRNKLVAGNTGLKRGR